MTDDARSLVLAALACAAWMLTLTLAIVSSRGAQMATDGKRVTDFPAGVPHGGDRYWRLNRAHANAAENLGLVGLVLLAAALAGVTGADARWLPWVLVAARMVQTTVHIASGAAPAVFVRATAFVIQLLCLLWLGGRAIVALLS